MGAGTYVGRIGGLAVALGIGVAVMTGQGIAAADTTDTSGTGKSSASDTTSRSESATDTTSRSDSATDTSRSDSVTDTATGSQSAPNRTADDSQSPAAPDRTSDGTNHAADDTDHADDPAEAGDPKASPDDHQDDAEQSPRRSNKRWKATEESSARDQDRDGGSGATAATAPATEAGPEPESEKGAPAADPVAAAEVEARVGAEAEVPPSTIDVPRSTIDVAVTAAPSVDEPKDTATVEVSNLFDELVNPFAGKDGEPTAPVDTPVVWALAAAARREFLGSSPEPEVAPLAAVTTEETVEPVEFVVARPVTPLLAPLQQVPILGPLFVTPVVALIKQVPFIGDILHPIIGYPIGFTGGTTPRDVKVISADGTAIYVHFFPAQGDNAGKVAPTILNGPGLGLPGETNPLAQDNPFLPNQVIGMAPLLQSGYNVVTWDPRGEWQSGGVLQIDHPDYEGRDMQAIISWIAQQPEALLDAKGDPRIGMVGASYGGGIQLVTAAIDKRVDAIAPTIAWNNLNTSLYKAEAIKLSWGALLTAALILTGARVNPEIYTAVATGLLTGQITQAQQDFLDARSPDRLLGDIKAPTLLLQGTVDTLFTLQEAHENAVALIANGVPTKVVWFCGGHGACISSTNDGELVERATMDWLNKYVMGAAVDTGPQFEWVDQRGQVFASNTYPVKAGPSLQVSSTESQTLPLWLLIGGSGPNFDALRAGPIGALLGILSGARAANAVELTLPEQPITQYLVGAPQLEFTYSGTGTNRHVYAQLVDDTTGLVLGNQVTPIPVTLDGEEHVATVSLEQIAHTLAPGQTVTLQIVASAVEYQALWSSGRLQVSSIRLTVPTADAAAIFTPSAVETVRAA